MKKVLFLVLVTFLVFSVVQSQDTIPYQTSFESSDGFVASQSLDGQNGWAVDPSGGDATVIDTNAQDGAQSVELGANSQIDKPLTAGGTDSVIWMEGYFQGAGTTADPSFPGSDVLPASAIVFFSATNGIQCFDGDGAGLGSWQNTSVTTLDENTWYKISIRQDYTGKTWRCYINDTKTPASDLGFRDDSVNTLNGFRNFADTISYLDNFRVLPGKKGDANGDCQVDAADIITLLNDPSGSGFDLIQTDNADIDGNGSIDSSDFDALIDVILNRIT